MWKQHWRLQWLPFWYKGMQLIKDDSCLREIYRLLKFSPASEYQDVELNKAWNNTRFFEEKEQQIIEWTTYTKTDILYSRYYWMTKLIILYETIFGRDESLRQAQFKIIESIDWAEEVDCGILEQIETELGFAED